jgi:Tol biopolymer transport system component
VWSPDGGRIAAAFDEGVFVLDVSSSPAKVLERFPPDIDFRPYSWSPDGRWLAGSARYAYRDDLLVLDLKERTRRTVARDGNSPVWLPDGRRLLYSSLTNLSIVDVQTGRIESVMPLRRPPDQWGRTVALSADGKSLAYLQSQSEGDVWLMTLRDN